MTRLFAMLLTALLVSTPAAAQDVNKARELLEQALAALKPAPVTAITTAEAFTTALGKAVSGDVITLPNDFVYPDPLVLRAPITIRGAGIPLTGLAVRMDLATPLPKFTGGMSIQGDNVTLLGIEIRHTNPLTDVVVVSGAHVTLDRIRVLGDPVKGAKRGIAANSNGDLKILRSVVADAFATYPGSDSQAICAWDMAPGLLIEDNFLSAGSETVLIGGADPVSEARNPKDIIIRHNTITKNPAWQAQLIGVKNTLELKNARNVLIEDNDISYSWGGHGQDGYLLVFTVRNQDGRCPSCTIEDVTVQKNRFSKGAAAINALGTDNNHPSGTLTKVTIRTNTFTELNPTTFAGSNKLIILGGGSKDLTIDSNVFTSDVAVSSQLYFYGVVPANLHTNLVFTNNTLPKSSYGIFGEGVSVAKVGQVPPAWTKYVVNGTLSGNITTP